MLFSATDAGDDRVFYGAEGIKALRNACIEEGITMLEHVVAAAFVANDEKPYGVRIESGGHGLRADEPAEHGGGGSGPSPFGLLLSGLGACTAMTLRMYAERKRWPLDGVEVHLGYAVSDGAQRWIERVITLYGPLDEARRAKLAEKTPVTRAVRAGTEIRTTVGVPAVGR